MQDTVHTIFTYQPLPHHCLWQPFIHSMAVTPPVRFYAATRDSARSAGGCTIWQGRGKGAWREQYLDEGLNNRASQPKPEDPEMSERFYLPGMIVSAFVFAAIGIDKLLLMISGGWSLEAAGLTLCALIFSALSAYAAIHLWRTGRW